jgi:hypothetical protein
MEGWWSLVQHYKQDSNSVPLVPWYKELLKLWPVLPAQSALNTSPLRRH